MSDKHSCWLFGQIFRKLAKEDLDKTELAHFLWKEGRGLDFHPMDMEADEELASFGLARKRVDADYPEDGEVWFYGPPGDDFS